MKSEKQLTEQESLQLITSMIQKAKSSYHDKGTGSILWGTVVAIASFVTFLQREYDFKLPFDIFLIVAGAIIPQIFISIQESKDKTRVKKFEDSAVDSIWLVFGITLFGLTFYQNVVGNATIQLIEQEGWQMMKHYSDGSKPDEVIKPFPPSMYSIYILLYAMPTMVTGLVKKFTPMIIGATITYALFIWSCYTPSKYDMLFGTIAAITCWLIPGIILRSSYLKQKNSNV
jgi:hypothetical protein